MAYAPARAAAEAVFGFGLAAVRALDCFDGAVGIGEVGKRFAGGGVRVNVFQWGSFLGEAVDASVPFWGVLSVRQGCAGRSGGRPEPPAWGSERGLGLGKSVFDAKPPDSRGPRQAMPNRERATPGGRGVPPGGAVRPLARPMGGGG